MQYSEFTQLHNANAQTIENTWNSEFQNLVLNNEMSGDKSILNLHHFQHHQKDTNIMNLTSHQNEISDQKINQDLSNRDPKSEIQNQTINQNLQADVNNQQYSQGN